MRDEQSSRHEPRCLSVRAARTCAGCHGAVGEGTSVPLRPPGRSPADRTGQGSSMWDVAHDKGVTWREAPTRGWQRPSQARPKDSVYRSSRGSGIAEDALRVLEFWPCGPASLNEKI